MLLWYRLPRDRDPLVTVWVALDPATRANGCLEVIPGTHRLGLLSQPDEGSTGTVLLQRRVERPDGRFELMGWPPALEDYLNPQLGDKLIQGRLHSDLCHLLYTEIKGYFRCAAIAG